VTLSGNFTRQTEERRAYTDDLSHIGNIGRMIEVRGGMGSGSGWVAVVSFDRGDRCGSNGTKMDVAVAVLAELR
jgi:hypothetical protein